MNKVEESNLLLETIALMHSKAPPISISFHRQIDTTHRCSNHCRLFGNKDMYICWFSCNYHYCTEHACELMEVHDDCRVCPITGLVYPLELKYTPIHADNCDISRPDRSTVIKPNSNKRKRSVAPIALDQVPKITNGVQNLTLSTPKTPQTPMTPQTPSSSSSSFPSSSVTPRKTQQLDKLLQNPNTYCVNMRNWINKILPPNKDLPEHCSKREIIYQLCWKLWRNFLQTEAIQAFVCTYDIRYHVACVLYYMQKSDGFKANGVKIIPHIATVAKQLPQIKELEATLKIRQTGYTEASKIFRHCVSEFYRKEKVGQ